MKTNLTQTKFESAWASRTVFQQVAVGSGDSDLLQRVRAEPVRVGKDPRGGEIFKFTWDGKQSIFASGLNDPGDVAIDSAGNLFVVDYMICGGLIGNAAIYKITPNGVLNDLCLRVELPFKPGG